MCAGGDVDVSVALMDIIGIMINSKNTKFSRIFLEEYNVIETLENFSYKTSNKELANRGLELVESFYGKLENDEDETFECTPPEFLAVVGGGRGRNMTTPAWML